MILNILFVFPNRDNINDIIYNFNEDENYNIRYASNISESLEELKQQKFDIALIDMQFNDGTGLDLKKKMDEIDDIPTIVVTNINDDIKKVLAFEYGVDDYLVYPFNVLELKARIRAILRRYNSSNVEINPKEKTIILYDFEFNIIGRKLKFKGKSVDLTGKEFDLLYTLVSNSGKVFSREELAKKVWGDEYEGHLRTVDVHIRRLRGKMSEACGDKSFIHTKWGEGYFFDKNIT